MAKIIATIGAINNTGVLMLDLSSMTTGLSKSISFLLMAKKLKIANLMQ